MTKAGSKKMRAYVLIETGAGQDEGRQEGARGDPGQRLDGRQPRRRHGPVRLHRRGGGPDARLRRPARHRRDRLDRWRHPNHHVPRGNDRLDASLVIGGTEFISLPGAGAAARRSSCGRPQPRPPILRAYRPACEPSSVIAATTRRAKTLGGERCDAGRHHVCADDGRRRVEALLDALDGRLGHVRCSSRRDASTITLCRFPTTRTRRAIYWGEYAKDKIAGRTSCLRRWREHRLPVTIVRPTHVFGPLNTRNNETFFFGRLVRNRAILIAGAGAGSASSVDRRSGRRDGGDARRARGIRPGLQRDGQGP